MCFCRCVEHAVHIATKYVVETIAPTPPKPLHKKIRQLLNEACNSGEMNSDEVNQVLSSLDGGEDDDEADESDWTSGDALGKLLALIKQVISCTFTFLN